MLECDGKRFTFQDFWSGFEKLYLQSDRKSVSIYATTYADDLNSKTKIENPTRFDTALGEQICESFVGYMLGIISNNNNITDFQSEHPDEYKLIDKLYRAKVIQKDKS